MIFCDQACEVSEACQFDGNDCQGAESLVDTDLEFGLALQAELEAMITSWEPSAACAEIKVNEIIQRYQQYEQLLQSTTATPEDLRTPIARSQSLRDAINSMYRLNTTTIGTWIEKSCGLPPNNSNLDSGVVDQRNWVIMPDERFIASAWASEKSNYAMLRVYYSEFNVQKKQRFSCI